MHSSDMPSHAGGKKALSGTDLVHADGHVPHGLEVAPAISVTTSECHQWLPLNVFTWARIAFRNPEPFDGTNGLDEIDPWMPNRHVYSRFTQGTTTRAEKVLSKINVRVVTRYN